MSFTLIDSYKHYGLSIYRDTDSDKEYAVGTEEEINAAAREYILETLWAFNAEFIYNHIPIVKYDRNEKHTIAAIKMLQEKLDERANEIVRLLLGDNLESFIEEAIDCDGVGHFLASYDEVELESDEVEGLPVGLIAFRLN